MKRFLFNLLGCIFVIFGVIGIFVPLWPRTPFALAAAIFFAKANPKLHKWLLGTRLFGPYLDNYYNKRGIALDYKIRTCAWLWAALVFSMSLLGYVWVYILLAVIGIAVSTHIFVIKTKKGCAPDITYNLITCAVVWFWLGLAMFLAESPTPYPILTAIGAVISAIVMLWALYRRRKQT